LLLPGDVKSRAGWGARKKVPLGSAKLARRKPPKCSKRLSNGGSAL
jgi:hypothetical protein